MVHLLIPYVRLPHHHDPVLEEFTYGDIEARARKLKRDLKQGDYAFFHTTVRGHKYITAYYVIDRVLETGEAASNKAIRDKYQNPHIEEYREGKHREWDDVIIFGDPILSRILQRPLPFDRKLSGKLSLRIRFRKGWTDNQCIGFATRAWRELTDKDVEVLRNEIKKIAGLPLPVDAFLSADEIQHLREIDLEDFIVRNPKCLGEGLKLKERQYEITPADRIDLLFQDKGGAYVVVEMKLDIVGRKELAQLKRYMHQMKKYGKPVRGVLVCKDILPAFESAFKRAKDVRVLFYGWRFGLKDAEL